MDLQLAGVVPPSALLPEQLHGYWDSPGEAQTKTIKATLLT